VEHETEYSSLIPDIQDGSTALPEEALKITPEMLIQIPIRGNEIRNRKLTFEKNMSTLPLVVLLLITVNVIVFAFEFSTGALQNEQSIVLAGALKRDLVLHGEYWRLFSAAFLHGSTGHLVGNMIFLYIMGMATEHAFGSRRTTIIYFASAVSGSLLSMVMHPGPGVGASGAIFGLMGALVVYFWKNRDIFNLRDGNIGIFIAIVAVIQISLGFSDPYIDNNAHIGGFIGGALIAYWLKSRLDIADQPIAAFNTVSKVIAVASLLLVSFLWLLAYGHIHLICAQISETRYPRTAVNFATRALELNPSNDFAYLVRGTANFRAGNESGAFSDIQTYLTKHPDRTDSYETLGHICYFKKDYAAAIRYYTPAIRIQPSLSLLNSRGYSEILIGEYSFAREDFQRALTIDNKYAPAYGNLGLLYAIDGSYDAAIENIEKSYELDHSLTEVKSLIAALKSEKAGNKAAAINHYEIFIANTLNSPEWRAENAFAVKQAKALKADIAGSYQ